MIRLGVEGQRVWSRVRGGCRRSSCGRVLTVVHETLLSSRKFTWVRGGTGEQGSKTKVFSPLNFPVHTLRRTCAVMNYFAW